MSAITFAALLLLICAAVFTVLTPTLLLAAIGLAGTSALLALVMYKLAAPYAAVFELSVCAGLITVVFVSAISLTRPGTIETEHARAALRIRRFIWLPVLLVLASAAWLWLRPALGAPAPGAAELTDAREVLWNVRRFDILGQLVLILTGVFGVVLLFKQWNTEKSDDDQ